MATRQCMNKWHFSDWLIVTRQFLVGCLSGQPWKEEDSTTTFNQEKHGTFRISDEPRIHIYRQNRCSQMQQSNTTRAMWRHNQKSKSCKREEEKKHGPSKKYGAYAVRYKRHSTITREKSREYPGMSYQWPLYDMSRWRMIRTRHSQDTWRSASCLFSLLHVVATHVIILSDF